MRVYATTDQKLVGHPTPDGWDVLLVTSDTSDKVYRVDITHGRCSCPHWKNMKDPKVPCKHLRSLGFKPVFQPGEVAEPKKAKSVKVGVHYGK